MTLPAYAPKLAGARKRAEADKRAEELRDVIEACINDGMGLIRICKALEEYGHKPYKANKWHPHTVQRIIERLGVGLSLDPLAPVKRSDKAILFEYSGAEDEYSFCDLEVSVAPDGRSLIIATDREDNPGTNITDMAAEMATKVLRENKAMSPTGLIWIEHYPERGAKPHVMPEYWNWVTFLYDAQDNSFHMPSWRPLVGSKVRELQLKMGELVKGKK